MYDKITAREGYDGNTPTLTIRSGGKIIACFRGDSLHFADKITPKMIVLFCSPWPS